VLRDAHVFRVYLTTLDKLWHLLTEYARLHHGTVTWTEARGLGIPAPSIETWVRRGRLLRPEPQVLVVPGAPTTWYQRVSIAAGSGGGFASHRCAASLWRLDGFPPGPVEVVTVRHLRRKRAAWTVHETRVLREVDVDEVDGVACTSLVRTLCDLAGCAHRFLVAQALDDACRRWPGTLAAVDHRNRELARRGRRGVRLMAALVDERAARGRFTGSGFESRVLRLVLSLGLPEPVLQHCVRDGEFVAYLDLAWPDIRWVVECDSLAFHSGKRALDWDRQRRRHLKRLGWDVVEVTWTDVTERRARTGRELVALYRAREQSFRRPSAAI
jgi:hypothetical protein